MSVKSIECQLIQAQMKRYLAGTDFPDELLDQLERHLKACPDCQAEAHRQREALGGAPAEIAQAVVAAQQKKSFLDRLKSKIVGQPPSLTQVPGIVSAPGKAPFPTSLFDVVRTPKNLVLSVSLAAVLVTMSTVMRSPSSLFGQRASSVIAEKPATGEDTKAAATAQHGEATEHEPSDEHANHAEPSAPLSPDLREEDEAQLASTSSAHGEEQGSGHEDAPVHEKPVAQKPHKETVTHNLDQVGGDLLIADSAAPHKSSTKSTKPATKSQTKPTVKKTAVKAPRSSTRKTSASASRPRPRRTPRKAPRNVVRVYNP